MFLDRFICYCSNSWIILNSEEIMQKNKMYVQ